MKKPTIEEISAYIAENKANIDAEKFYWYYESVDWMVGKHPMKNWKAAIQTWIRNSKIYSKNERNNNSKRFSETRY